MDIENPDDLQPYLVAQRHISATEPVIFKQLAGGVSNRTVLVKRENGEAWVIKQALEKLRVAVDWFSSPLRIHREAEGLRWLARLAPADTIPAFIFEDHTHHLLAMAAVPEPHHNWKNLLLKGQLDLTLVEQFGHLLATIHRHAAQNKAEITETFGDRTFFESLRLEPYYGYTASQVPEAADFLHQLMADTRQRTITLVHGDYSPKNTLVYQNKLVLLDYEVIHFGDPAFDLGFSLTHFLSKAHHLPHLRADFVTACQVYWQAYQATLGKVGWADQLEAWTIRHTLACLLARVAGRSPLEYLDEAEREQQREAVIALISHLPESITELSTRFSQKV